LHSHQYSITKENRKKYKGNGNEDLVGHLYLRVVLFHEVFCGSRRRTENLSGDDEDA
jgi:hypothetical protein